MAFLLFSVRLAWLDKAVIAGGDCIRMEHISQWIVLYLNYSAMICAHSAGIGRSLSEPELLWCYCPD